MVGIPAETSEWERKMTLAERLSRLNWGGEGFPSYDGECKGADTANQQRQQELQMQQKAFDAQMGQLAQLKSAFSKYLGGDIGFDPAGLASMRSQFLGENQAAYNQAGQQVRSALGARGAGTGALPVGGDYVRGISGLMGARAGSQAQGLLGIDVQNAQQKLANMFNSGNLLS